MAFVNELIPEEEKYRFNGWKNGIGDIFTPYKWTIDYEQDAFLVKLGNGFAEIPAPYAFCWHGEIIKLRAFVKISGTNDAGEVSWEIFTDHQRMEARMPGSIELLKKAIEAYGYLYDNHDIKKVDIKFA